MTPSITGLRARPNSLSEAAREAGFALGNWMAGTVIGRPRLGEAGAGGGFLMGALGMETGQGGAGRGGGAGAGSPCGYLVMASANRRS